jgi:hypothetical protein
LARPEGEAAVCFSVLGDDSFVFAANTVASRTDRLLADIPRNHTRSLGIGEFAE